MQSAVKPLSVSELIYGFPKGKTHLIYLVYYFTYLFMPHAKPGFNSLAVLKLCKKSDSWNENWNLYKVFLSWVYYPKVYFNK